MGHPHAQRAAGQRQGQQLVARIESLYAAFDHHARVVFLGDGQVEARQGLVERSAGQHPAVVQQHQVIGQARHFIGRMTDVEQRNIQFVMQALQIGEDFTLALEIQRRQGFVHQQQARAGQQGAGDADALAFAAGQAARHAFQQMTDTQQFHRVVQFHPAILRGNTPLAELQVASHREVFEQAGLLEHIAQRPLVGG
ncbi:hypothetical protein FQZ97_502980 [compost metagenome]